MTGLMMANNFDNTNPLFQGFTRNAVFALAESANQGISQAIHEWIKTRGPLKNVMQDAIGSANAKTVEYGQKETLKWFDKARKKGKRRYPTSYREDSGRAANGKLAAAIGNESNFQSDAYGIKFIDVDLMDRQAPQWYRLNFGAGPKASAIEIPAMRNPINNRIITPSPNFDSYGPSDSFSMPGDTAYSWWLMNGHEIHVGKRNSGSNAISGLGIESEGWIHEGLAAMNERYPTYLLKSLKDKFDNKNRTTVINLRLPPITSKPRIIKTEIE